MSRIYKNVIFLLIVQSSCLCVLSSLINWKSVTCENIDEEVAVYKSCYIKPQRRNVAALNVHINIKRRPLSDFYVNVNFKKRANGWKPFLYNFTINACEFLANKKRSPLVNFFYSFTGLASHSNLNHSCPFNEDIYVVNHTFFDTTKVSETLPLPSGYYAIFTTWIADKLPRIKANVYFTIEDYLNN